MREKIDKIFYFFALWIAFSAIILQVISIVISIISQFK